MRGLKAILVDLDDTLLDHRGAADRAVAEWAAAFVPDSPPEDPARRWLRLETTYFRMFERGEVSIAEQRRRRIRDFAPAFAGVDDPEADRLFGQYMRLYRRHWRAFPGAAELMDSAMCAGLRVGVLTNGDEALQRDKLSVISLLRPGLSLFAASALGVAKPSVRAYEMACDAIGAVPGETVMVGDSYVNDVVAARAAGLRAIHVAPRPGDGPGDPGSLWAASRRILGRG